MQHRLSRYLGDFLRATEEKQSGNLGKGGQLSWRDHLLMMLQIDVGLEHALMVQYLYAAYSLGGEQVPPDKRDMVRRWQQTFLSIAKEEMGHLLTVQNIITCMGGSLYLDRQDYPWEHDYHPFPFELEPLTLQSLAKYVYAEAPVGWKAPSVGTEEVPEKVPEWDDICKQAFRARPEGERPPEVQSVAVLFTRMLAIVRDSYLISDADFFPETFSQQANWDTWACNQGNVSGEDAPDHLRGDKAPPQKPTLSTTADVLVIPVATRDDVIAALEKVASQGEAPHAHKETSHFHRFYTIYQEFTVHFPEGSDARPARELPVNPTTFKPLPRESGDTTRRSTYIDNPVARQWAKLFNMRYRLLLTYLTHSFRLARGVTPNKGPGNYQMVRHRAFCEMYNLKALSEILIRQPLDKDEPFKPAGPTFQMPYTLSLPESAAGCWMQYLGILKSCEEAGDWLRDHRDAPPTQQEKDFLVAMSNADQECKAWLDTVLKATRVGDQVL